VPFLSLLLPLAPPVLPPVAPEPPPGVAETVSLGCAGLVAVGRGVGAALSEPPDALESHAVAVSSAATAAAPRAQDFHPLGLLRFLRVLRVEAFMVFPVGRPGSGTLGSRRQVERAARIAAGSHAWWFCYQPCTGKGRFRRKVTVAPP